VCTSSLLIRGTVLVQLERITQRPVDVQKQVVYLALAIFLAEAPVIVANHAGVKEMGALVQEVGDQLVVEEVSNLVLGGRGMLTISLSLSPSSLPPLAPPLSQELLVKGQQLVGCAQLLTVEDPDATMVVEV
jgi:hypothetical protein